MTEEPDDHECPPDASAEGELLLQCLDQDGERADALANLCAQNPTHSSRLRRLFGILHEFGLVDERPADEALPDRIGPYRVLERIGAGGMGVIYLAEHETLHRRVALKVIHAALDSAKARERFRREAMAASRLDHPAICTVYEAGHDDGRPFLAMRFVPGRTLARHVADGLTAKTHGVSLPGPAALHAQARVLFFAQRVAEALHAAHEQGLVHRDVKPSNLMVTPDGEPVLLDFGLASLTADSDGSLTRTGDQLGTPLYMAPEQVAGRNDVVDRRSDVYALGVVLYECLVLQPPFDAVQREGLFRQILHEPPRDPRRSQPWIGRDLWTVLQTALAKEPDHRYASAHAFAEDLRRVRDGEPIAARPPGAWWRLRTFVRAHPRASALVTLLTLSLVATAVALTQIESALRRTQAAQLRAESQATLATDPLASLRSALAAHELEPGAAALSLVQNAVAHQRCAAILEHGTHGAVRNVCLAPAAKWLVTATADGFVHGFAFDGERVSRAWVFRPGGTGELASFASSASGDRVLHAVRGEPTARWLDVATGGTRGELIHGAPIRCATLAYDGENVLTGGDDGVVRVWHPSGEVTSFATDGAAVLAAVLTHDGSAVYAADANGTMHRWRRDGSVHETRPLPSPHLQPPFLRCELDLDGRDRWLLASWDDKGSLLWETDPFRDHALPRDSGQINYRMQWAPFHPDQDRQRFLGIRLDSMINVWSIFEERDETAGPDRAPSIVFDNPQKGSFRGFRIAPPGARTGIDGHVPGLYATFGPTAEIGLYKLGGASRGSLRGHRGAVNDAVFDAEGNWLLSAGADGTARLWRILDAEVMVMHPDFAAMSDVVFCRDGRVLVEGPPKLNKALQLFDAARTQLTHVPLRAGHSWSPEVVCDPLVFATATHQRILPGDGAVVGAIVFDCSNEPPLVVKFLPHPVASGDEVLRVRLSPDGRRALTVSKRSLRLFDLTIGTPVDPGSRWSEHLRYLQVDGVEVPHGNGQWTDVVWTDDGAGFLVAGEAAVTRAWTLTPLALGVAPRGLTATSTVAAWHGAAFALGGGDGIVRVFRDDGEPLHTLAGHQGEVTSLAFSPDGQRLISGGSDGMARIWDWHRGVEVAHYRAFADARVDRISFAPDGRTFVTSALYNFTTPNLWFTWPDDLLVCANRRANPLTAK